MKSYKKELDKKYKGYRYIVLGLNIGHRCGYVKIPKDNPLFGLGYSTKLPITMYILKNETVGKRSVIPFFLQGLDKDERISMDVLFDVHGGITFSGDVKQLGGYWIGFDCAHYDDAKDVSLMDKKYKKLYNSSQVIHYGTIKTTDYVEQECKNLIDQIIKYSPLLVKNKKWKQ